MTRSAEDSPAAVVQGFAPEVGWTQLAEAAFALKVPEEEGGIPWIATNTDWTIPQSRGIAPGNGTLVSAVHTAVGRLATVAGKPEVPIFEEAVARFGARHPLFLGDRLDTDILGANRAGIPSALVLTGIDRPKHVLAAPAGSQPTFILGDLRELHEPYPEVRRRRRRRDACAARRVRDRRARRPHRVGRATGRSTCCAPEPRRSGRPAARSSASGCPSGCTPIRSTGPDLAAARIGDVAPVSWGHGRARRARRRRGDLLSPLEVIEAQPLATRADGLRRAARHARPSPRGRRPARHRGAR